MQWQGFEFQMDGCSWHLKGRRINSLQTPLVGVLKGSQHLEGMKIDNCLQTTTSMALLNRSAYQE